MMNSFQILVAAALAGTQFNPAGCRTKEAQKIPDCPCIAFFMGR